MPRSGFVRARLYDVRGRVVRTLLDIPELSAGIHTFGFDRSDDRGVRLPAGLYFYRLETATGARAGRFVYLE